MLSPLTDEYSSLSMDEIQKKITEINGKIAMAYGFGNSQMVEQLYFFLDELQMIAAERMRQEAEKQEKDRQAKRDMNSKKIETE